MQPFHGRLPHHVQSEAESAAEGIDSWRAECRVSPQVTFADGESQSIRASFRGDFLRPEANPNGPVVEVLVDPVHLL